MVSEPEGHSEEAERGEPPKRSRPNTIIRVFRALRRHENRRRRRHKKEASETEITMARWARRVGWLTVALVGVGIVSAIIFWRQLNEMQSEQRPWVYAVDISPGGHIILAKERYAVPSDFL